MELESLPPRVIKRNNGYSLKLQSSGNSMDSAIDLMKDKASAFDMV